MNAALLSDYIKDVCQINTLRHTLTPLFSSRNANFEAASIGFPTPNFEASFKRLSYIPDFYYSCGWSGGAIALGKLPVPGRSTIWMIVGQGPIALAIGAGGGVWTFLYHRHLCRGVYSFRLSVRPIVCSFVLSFVCSFFRSLLSVTFVHFT